jgi:glycosyltransferase involved in cell wall biosynthesis
LEELVPAIEECDVGIIPNHRSRFTELNTPTRIFEYLALGKPVIAPRAAGVCDYFDDSSLVFFELGDAEDLALKIEYVFSHPAEVRETVRRGQDVYREHPWAVERLKLRGLVAELLGKEVAEVDSKGSAPQPRQSVAL